MLLGKNCETCTTHIIYSDWLDPVIKFGSKSTLHNCQIGRLVHVNIWEAVSYPFQRESLGIIQQFFHATKPLQFLEPTPPWFETSLGICNFLDAELLPVLTPFWIDDWSFKVPDVPGPECFNRSPKFGGRKFLSRAKLRRRWLQEWQMANVSVDGFFHPGLRNHFQDPSSNRSPTGPSKWQAAVLNCFKNWLSLTKSLLEKWIYEAKRD